MRINLTSKQKIISASAAGCLVIAIIVTVCLCNAKVKPPVTTAENAPAVAKFIGSEQFASLDKSAKKEYMDQVNQDPELRQAMWSQREILSEQERSAMRQNMREVREQQMQERMDKYFALKTPAEKNKMLDEILSDMQKHAKDRPQRAAGPRPNNGGNANEPANRPSREAHRKTRIETTSSQARAQRRQFMNDLRARAKALGIEMPFHHGHR